VISAERLILHSRIAAEPQTSSTAIAPAERDGMERADGEAQGDGDEEERVYTRADVEAAVQSLAELLPGSVPTPRLQPPEVPLLPFSLVAGPDESQRLVGKHFGSPSKCSDSVGHMPAGFECLHAEYAVRRVALAVEPVGLCRCWMRCTRLCIRWRRSTTTRSSAASWAAS